MLRCCMRQHHERHAAAVHRHVATHALQWAVLALCVAVWTHGAEADCPQGEHIKIHESWPQLQASMQEDFDGCLC